MCMFLLHVNLRYARISRFNKLSVSSSFYFFFQVFLLLFFWANNFTRVGWKIHWLKNPHDDVISSIDDYFDQWDPRDPREWTPPEELRWKINHIWSHFLGVSWLASEFFSQLLYIYIYIYIYHHYHHIASPARISQTLSRHPSLSSITPGRCSRLHPVSAQSSCKQVLAGRPA